jgi:hypothetical protein
MQRAWRSSTALSVAAIALLTGCTRDDDLIATLKVSASGGASGGSAAGNSMGGGMAAGGSIAVAGMAGSAGAMPSPCALGAGEPAPLARYDFEDPEGATSLLDAQALQDALLIDGTFTSTAGPEGCGRALSFDESSVFAVISNLSAWDLEAGSIDFWFRVPDVVENAYGILGRDHVGTDLPGHLSVWLTADRTVTLRLQGASVLATQCSEDPLPLGQWVHVGFNFGAPGSELWVDGKLALRTGDPRIETVVPECGGSTPDGIAGNEQPWVLGFDTSRSGDALDGLLQHFDGGALDALQISAVRRNFSKP